jgi:hypothetical protein
MDPRTRTPPGAPAPQDPAAQPELTPKEKQLDQELDQELDDTFPASDPLPWSHEVK